MYGTKSKIKPNAAKADKGPIRVVVRCAWSGARLTVPTTGAGNADALPLIRGSTTLLELLLRLESALPPSLFQGDASGASPSTATLVCLRKVVPQAQWESTTLKQMLDGDDGCAGVVLTLDLGAESATSAPKKSAPGKNVIAAAATSLSIKPVVASAGTATIPSATTVPVPEPMDTSTAIAKMLPDQAWDVVLRSNFDATSKDCLNTLLKIIDNLLSRPNDPKVRSIRCANAAFEKKVGLCSGSYDFLYSIGFSPTYPSILGGMSAGNARPETLELTNESRETLLRGRKALIQSAVRDLGTEEDDFPPLPKTLESLPTSTLAAPPAPAPESRHNSRGPTSGFNVYKTHSHNIQSAAVGAPDPYSDAASTMSTTERQLQQLQSKKDKMEREMHSKIETDRGLVAFRAGSGPTSMGASTTAASSGGGKSDSSLVAARMKRMEEERKKREEGFAEDEKSEGDSVLLSFPTVTPCLSSNNLLTCLLIQVYSHAQIRVNFPDGTHLHAKFLPREKVAALRSVIESAFEDSLSPSLEFDLYVAPPRRLLIDTNTLEEEELVPAAKIHVSWKVGAAPVGGTAGCFVRPELFAGGNAGTSAFPDAKPVLKEKKAPEKSKGEDLLMQRMLGKNVGLGRKSSSSDGGGNAQKKSGKPKWFKG
ncbi:hypothetical protein ACHAWF_006759 [Thalassiosira exigua]